MPTVPHPSSSDRSLMLQLAVSARAAADFQQSLDEDPNPDLDRIETGAVALYKVLADGRRQVIGFAFVVAGGGGVAMAVQAMKGGAVDCVEMPVGREQLLASVQRALGQTQNTAMLLAPRTTDATRVASLTRRQRQVLDLVLAGFHSKNIAADLGISQRTVENHRAAIMRKTGSKSIPGLVRIALAAA
jgi:FixJ family two-component response regulator